MSAADLRARPVAGAGAACAAASCRWCAWARSSACRAPPGLDHAAPALVLDRRRRRPSSVTCDKVIGPREIVVRSLGPLLGRPAALRRRHHLRRRQGAAHPRRRSTWPTGARHGVRGARPTRALGPRRVLVVDDSRSIRETASLILAQGGYAVEAVPDGWDAWELLQDRPFDVLRHRPGDAAPRRPRADRAGCAARPSSSGCRWWWSARAPPTPSARACSPPAPTASSPSRCAARSLLDAVDAARQRTSQNTTARRG